MYLNFSDTESTKSTTKPSQDHKRGSLKRAFTFTSIIFALRYWFFSTSFNEGCTENLTCSIPFWLSVAINLRLLRLPISPLYLDVLPELSFAVHSAQVILAFLMGKFKVLRLLVTLRAYWERTLCVRWVDYFWVRV